MELISAPLAVVWRILSPPNAQSVSPLPMMELFARKSLKRKYTDGNTSEFVKAASDSDIYSLESICRELDIDVNEALEVPLIKSVTPLHHLY